MHSPQDEWLGPTDADTKSSSIPDVIVRNAGTLYLFCPMTERARAWIFDNVQPDAQWFGHALVVETRFAWGLAQSMIGEGFVLA